MQLPFGPIADGQFLKRVGTGIIGVTAGSGDVVGPAGAGDGHVALFDGTTGKLIKDGGRSDERFNLMVPKHRLRRHAIPTRSRTPARAGP